MALSAARVHRQSGRPGGVGIEHDFPGFIVRTRAVAGFATHTFTVCIVCLFVNHDTFTKASPGGMAIQAVGYLLRVTKTLSGGDFP